MKVENLLVFIRIYAKFDVPKKKKREGAKALPLRIKFYRAKILKKIVCDFQPPLHILHSELRILCIRFCSKDAP